MSLSNIIVELATALICFNNACYPALIGKDTPRGEFQVRHYAIEKHGYGGDLLVFKETDGTVFAIHRVLDIKGQFRLERLQTQKEEDRKNITDGCVNVDASVYGLIIECCSTSKVIIK
jgi:hypothetical protein